MSNVQCDVCPHGCVLAEGQTGFCRARSNQGGIIKPDNYGRLTAIALDPIEKKPLRRFHPGSLILSVGSFGCNLRCSFCQNYTISMADKGTRTVYVSPQELVDKAVLLKDEGNIGIAFTYNEPLIDPEYVYDCAQMAQARNLKIVLVTNGYINEAPLKRLLPYIDAMNIDLKAFNEAFYKHIGGDLNTVKQTIEAACAQCHVEVTTLIIPGENDDIDEMREMSVWLANINSNIPLHISRFFPQYKMTDREATSRGSIYSLSEIARESLMYVYEGNC